MEHLRAFFWGGGWAGYHVHGPVPTRRLRVSTLLRLFWNYRFCDSNTKRMWFVAFCRLQEWSIWVSKCWCSCNSTCSCVAKGGEVATEVCTVECADHTMCHM